MRNSIGANRGQKKLPTDSWSSSGFRSVITKCKFDSRRRQKKRIWSGAKGVPEEGGVGEGFQKPKRIKPAPVKGGPGDGCRGRPLGLRLPLNSLMGTRE